jgi:hypothetical protein
MEEKSAQYDWKIIGTRSDVKDKNILPPNKCCPMGSSAGRGNSTNVVITTEACTTVDPGGTRQLFRQRYGYTAQTQAVIDRLQVRPLS